MASIEGAARLQRAGWKFASAALVSSGLVVSVGWLTDMREGLHAALLALAVVAFLPMLMLAVLVAIWVVVMVVGGFASGGADIADYGVGEAAVVGGGKLIRVYYRLVWTARKNPWLLGGIAGFAVGVFALWGLVTLVVLPNEARTVDVLLSAQQGLEAAREARRSYPPVAAKRTLSRAILRGAAGTTSDGEDQVILDGFGRPILYELKQGLFGESYTLRSQGYDGVPSKDDLCVSGQARLKVWFGRALEPLVLIEALRSGLGERARVVQSTKCAPALVQGLP